MVALRGRFTAITFVALMVAAGFASMVPTAAADHLVINSVAVKIFVEGQERTSADPGGVVVLNQQVRLRVEADISASCASTVPGAVEVQVFTSANLSSFGDFSNRTPIPGDSTLRTPYIAEHVFQLALLPNGTNNVTNPFDVFIEVACQLVGTDEDVPGGGTTEPAERTRAQATAPAIRYDNVAPVLTIAPGVGAGTYRIGQSVPLNVLANVSSDLAGYTIDYSQLTRSVGVNGIVSGTVAANGVPISRTITIEDTGIESATVVGTLTDDRGYTGLVYFAPRIPPTPTHTFDARRPALASAVLEPKFTNATQFTFTPDESHAQNSDLVNYSVRFSNATSAFSVDCLKSATAPGCARISPGVYNVTDTRLTANEAYTVTLPPSTTRATRRCRS